MVNRIENVKTYDQFVCDAKKHDKEKWDEIEFHANIISKIVIERTKQGISQEQLAKMTGLKQSAIARIESCNCVPKITTLQKILNRLGLTLEIRKQRCICSKGKVLPIYDSLYCKEQFSSDEVEWIKARPDKGLTNLFKGCG